MKKKDFLKELELMALISRIKRLCDDLQYSTKDFYKSLQVDIEPNWSIIFLLFKKYGTLTITDISEYLRQSHPAVIKVINKMKTAGYINSVTDEKDSRKQILSLSDKALKAFPEFEQYWNACVATMKEITNDCPNFLEDLGKIEQKVQGSSYKERTLRNLQL
ncbi:MarR family winged helix-turn-helix transcriptional regulator [Pedobacter montanisoli]|uniref:MarR family transcriptional regulator n=1 Tax=Pedobacter montanisoli TaxID=2923277 RepID=A0ABS9ZYP0_9SPHI|nr:MarR family transcriptional regulator [Pedobacter montanisoli]MCJ0743428.1 MarR family transcriptional regulator [Pedobacter montanisoli]